MITKNRLLLILGLWIALVPFLGFPGSYRSFLIIVSGLAVAFITFLVARERRKSGIPSMTNSRANEVFTESIPQKPEEKFTDIAAIREQSKNNN